MVNNPVCATCDYVEACHKRISVTEPMQISALIKDLRAYKPNCISRVQPICRDCALFAARRCASWKVLNGKNTLGNLKSCPKKLPANPPFG